MAYRGFTRAYREFTIASGKITLASVKCTLVFLNYTLVFLNYTLVFLKCTLVFLKCTLASMEVGPSTPLRQAQGKRSGTDSSSRWLSACTSALRDEFAQGSAQAQTHTRSVTNIPYYSRNSNTYNKFHCVG